MIKGIITVAIFLLPFLSTAQFKTAPGALTFTQFTGLFAMDQSVVMDYMSLRGWEFYNAEKEREDAYAYISWSYIPTPEKLHGFFSVLFENKFDKKSMRYMTIHQNYFNNMKAEAQDAGLKMLKSGMLENGIYTDYEANNFVMRFSTSKTDNMPPEYYVHIYNKQFYYDEVSD